MCDRQARVIAPILCPAWGEPVPFSVPQRGMERREAPGACEGDYPLLDGLLACLVGLAILSLPYFRLPTMMLRPTPLDWASLTGASIPQIAKKSLKLLAAANTRAGGICTRSMATCR